MVQQKKDTTLEQLAAGLKSSGAPVAGQNLYIHPAEYAFVQRIVSWLKYLKIADLFPDAEKLSGRIHEMGSKLRSAGDASFLGLSDAAANLMLVRPGDYTAVLHEATHINPAHKGYMLSSEAGAFASQIFAAGDFDGNIGFLMGSDTYVQFDKRAGRLLAEASMVLGRRVFDALRTVPGNDYFGLAATLRTESMKLMDDMKFNRTSARDYLVKQHGLTPFVADYLIAITGDTAATIVPSTTQAKKDVIGAFKALASFYHVNLGLSIDEAVSRTENHFRDNEAVTLSKTLTTGSKEVFAKLQEYGYPLDMCKTLCGAMISWGGMQAVMYAKGIPDFIELCGQIGPKGRDLMEYAFDHKAFFDAMTMTDGAKGMLALSETYPEEARMILSELRGFDWKFAFEGPDWHKDGPSWGGQMVLTPHRLYTVRQQSLFALPPRERAKLVATSFYLAAMPEQSARMLGFTSYFGHIEGMMQNLPKEQAPSAIMDDIIAKAAKI